MKNKDVIGKTMTLAEVPPGFVIKFNSNFQSGMMYVKTGKPSKWNPSNGFEIIRKHDHSAAWDFGRSECIVTGYAGIDFKEETFL